ncbi:MAG: threonine--tRNA ligase, partial [Candidatus Omnitrophota bacterium]
EFEAELSTRPEEFIGEIEKWNTAEHILQSVLEKKKFFYKINVGEGAFYGPKIDIKLKDALKRSWQCATIQLDYSLPERFDLTYHAPDGRKKRPVMIHRVILGSLERFIATLVEHYAGKFPFWLAPTQICVINITKEVTEYAKAVKEKLAQHSYRVEIDLTDQTLERKIREKELKKIPYLVVVGKREKERNLISVRERGKKQLGEMSIEEFISILKKEEVGD